MKYVAFVGTEGAMPKSAIEQMQRDFPAYLAEMDPRRVRLFGRELDFPPTAQTVRVLNGEALVTDGPFAETTEYIGGFDLLECADRAEAIEVESKSPVARFLPFEIRPFRDDALRLGPAFDSVDDAHGLPYVFLTWARDGELPDTTEYDAWQRSAGDAHLFGGILDGPGEATTLRPTNGEIRVSGGPFLDPGLTDGRHLASLDAIVCADPAEAATLASRHPMATGQVVEVRPFHP